MNFGLHLFLRIFIYQSKCSLCRTTKDVIGHMNHTMLLAAMRNANNPVQRLRNALAAKQDEVEVVQATLEAT